MRVVHLGDFGQSTLREEQAAAIVRSSPVRARGGRWVVPMPYRTERLNFLETAEDFLARMDDVRLLDAAAFDTPMS